MSSSMRGISMGWGSFKSVLRVDESGRLGRDPPEPALGHDPVYVTHGDVRVQEPSYGDHPGLENNGAAHHPDHHLPHRTPHAGQPHGQGLKGVDRQVSL